MKKLLARAAFTLVLIVTIVVVPGWFYYDALRRKMMDARLPTPA